VAADLLDPGRPDERIDMCGRGDDDDGTVESRVVLMAAVFTETGD